MKIVIEKIPAPPPHQAWVAYFPDRPGLGRHYGSTSFAALEAANLTLDAASK